MNIKIINQKLDDNIIIEAENVEELRKTAKIEMDKRGWLSDDCYSENNKKG